MSGVTSTAAAALILLVIVVGIGGLAGWIVALPVLLLASLVMLLGPARRFFVERGQPGTDEPDVPSTSDASYDPVNESQR